jgi:hypothetical protein
MTKPKWLLILGALVLVLIALRMARSYFESPWARAYSRIKLGMTLQEVQYAIGVPPGYYEGEEPLPPSMDRHLKTPPLRQSGLDFEGRQGDDPNLEAWIGRDYCIWVVFDERGAAVGSYLFELYPDNHRQREPAYIRWLRRIFG